MTGRRTKDPREKGPTLASTETDRISDQAIDWLVRLNSGSNVEATSRDCENWLAQHPDHQTAFAQAKHIWEDVGVHPESWAMTPHLHASSYLVSRKLKSLQAVAALFAVVIFATTLPTLLAMIQADLADHQTGKGEQRALHLADGSTVLLNTATAINVRMVNSHREVTLLEGEANFLVAPDPARPFVVRAGNTRATALGTEFTVRSIDEDTIVTVLDHAVAVSQHKSSSADPTSHILTAGQQVTISDRTGMGQVESVNLAMAKSWQHGKLMFDERPLGEVVAELNRYHTGSIVLLNADLEGLKVTGVFDLSNVPKAMDAIHATLGLSLITLPPYLTILL